MHSQGVLAQRIISDDLTVERIAPNEETRLLLGNAIAKFSDEYWPDKVQHNDPTRFYSYPICTPLYKSVWRK